MIQEFVDRFMAAEQDIKKKFSEKHPGDYNEIVKTVVEVIGDPEQYDTIDPERIHVIDDGDYQGTLLFVIGANGYLPSDYWYVKVYYGSCSGCDTLQSIEGYTDAPPSEDQVKDYWTLALHVVQGIKAMSDSQA